MTPRQKAKTKRVNVHLERYELIDTMRKRFLRHPELRHIPPRALSDAAVIDTTLAILLDVMKTFPEPRYQIVDQERFIKRWLGKILTVPPGTDAERETNLREMWGVMMADCGPKPDTNRFARDVREGRGYGPSDEGPAQ